MSEYPCIISSDDVWPCSKVGYYVVTQWGRLACGCMSCQVTVGNATGPFSKKEAERRLKGIGPTGLADGNTGATGSL